MPFTPFHMGPGLLLKSLLQGYFSLIIFGWAQVLMDIQPLVVMITGKGKLHGFSHTYIGATLIALFAAYTGRWIYRWCMRFVAQDFTSYQQQLFAVPAQLKTGICIVSAGVGSYSHVLLDSIMHPDLEPFFPVNPDNYLVLLMSIGTLYKLCVYTGLAGAVIYFAVRLVKIKLQTKAARIS